MHQALPGEPEVRVAHVPGDVVVVSLLGEHDIATAWEVRNALAFAFEPAENLVVDLSETEFIDSSIIHALFESEQLALEHGRRVSLQLPTHAAVTRALELSGMLATLPVYGTRAEAIDAVRQMPDWVTRQGTPDQVAPAHSQRVKVERTDRRGLRESVEADPFTRAGRATARTSCL